MPKTATDPLRQLYRAVRACERALHPDAVAAREAALERQRAAERRLASLMKDEGAYYVSDEFREEVIDALVAEGVTLVAAKNRTRDSLLLHTEAVRLRLK